MSKNQQLIPFDHASLEPLGSRASPVVTLEAEGTETPLDLLHYWRILLKRRWAILTVAFVVTTVVAMLNFRMKPVYEAKVRVEVESEEPQLQSVSDFARGVPSDEVFLRTQVQVLESDSLAWQTIEQLGWRNTRNLGRWGRRRAYRRKHKPCRSRAFATA